MSDSRDEFEIRRMVASDLTSVMRIAASLQAAPRWNESVYLDALNHDALNHDARDRESTPRRMALVAVDRGEGCVEGFAVASLLAEQAELETIAVAARSQRLGCGKRLFSELVGELRDAGVHEILLEVRATNRTAIAFYRSLGFEQTGQRRGYYADPVEDAVIMRRGLD